MFDTDEHVRGESSMEGMAKLRAVFVKENAASPPATLGINDAPRPSC